MSGKELLTAAEAAETLKITRRTLLKWARENKIESVKLSRKVVLFSTEAIDDFVESGAKKIEPAPINHPKAGRKSSSRILQRKGGGKRTSGESWRDLRQEVSLWD
jgi:excisionase family DNA binding protein